MAILTIRNLPDEVHRALSLRAMEHGQSTEAEEREILENAVKPEGRLRMGDALAEISRRHGVTNTDVEILEKIIDERRAEHLDLNDCS